jgi:hypothetical protein
MFDFLTKTKNSVANFTKPTATVEMVHRDFDEATDNLIKEANGLLAHEETSEERELLELSKLGFKSLKGIKVIQAKEKKKQYTEQMIALVNEYKKEYPDFTFISESDTKAIIKKYGLVLAQVEFFTGVIPAKNRGEILEFNKKMKKPEPLELGELREYRVRFMSNLGTNLYTLPNSLKIVATLDQFNLDNYDKKRYIMEIKDNEVILKDKDPIVLYEVSGGYFIVSKWGTEADLM